MNIKITSKMKNLIIVILIFTILGLIGYISRITSEYQKREDTLIMMYNSKCDHSKINYKLLRSY